MIIYSLELCGSLGFMFNWNVDIGLIGYDFVCKFIIYFYLGLCCDLYCWEMGFNWVFMCNIYFFYFCVKLGMFDFFKVFYQ